MNLVISTSVSAKAAVYVKCYKAPVMVSQEYNVIAGEMLLVSWGSGISEVTTFKFYLVSNILVVVCCACLRLVLAREEFDNS